MVKIGIIILLISLINGEICILTEEQITQLKKSFNEAKNYMDKEATNEDAAICVGTARAGKSTLINYLIGNELRGVRYSPFGEYKIIKADNRSRGPEIGAGPISKTKIPTKWISDKLPGLKIFDSPGFQDNRGPVQDITNSFYIYQLMKNVKSLKFILVVNFGDIERANIKPLLRLLHDFEKLFGNTFQEVFSSISVIISKVPHELYETTVDIEMIQHMLREKIYTTEETSYSIKNFFGSIMENKTRIGLFKQARNDKIITSDIEVGIFSAINNSEKVGKSVLQNVVPSISDNSLLCLQNAKNKWVSITEILEIQKLILISFTNLLSEWTNLNNSLDSNVIVKNQNKLNLTERLLNDSITNDIDIYENIKAINKINTTLKEIIDKRQLLKKVELFEFLSLSLKSNENEYLHLSFRTLIMSLHTAVKVAINKLAVLNEKMPRQEFENKSYMDIKEVNETINNFTYIKRKSQTRKLKIIFSLTFFLLQVLFLSFIL